MATALNKRPHPSTLVHDMLGFGSLNGVKVCFINMPLRETAKPNTPPQGPGLMAARLEQYGADVSIIDLNGDRIHDALSFKKGLVNGRHRTILETYRYLSASFNLHGEPHLIGFSGKITTLRWQKRVAKICRRLAPKSFIISGGGLSTEFKDGIFNWIPELDAVGHSEGDDIILLCAHDIKRSWSKRGDMTDSLYYIGDIRGRKRWMYHGDRPHDLDALPFAALHLLEKSPYGKNILEEYIKTPVWGMAAGNSSAAPFEMQRSLTTVSSRGCPHACGFCYRGAQGERNWGIRSPSNLRAEAEMMIAKYGVDFIGFPDDNFAVSVKRCQALPAAFEGLKFRWGTHTRLDECTMDRLEPMAKSGCIYIGVGAESADKKTLYRMVKGGHIVRKNGVERMTKVGDFEFPTTMMEGIANCRTLGIHTNATWIMAYPGEALRELQTSVAFIKWQEELYTQGLTPGTPEYATAKASVNRRMFVATAYPGTSMFKDPSVRALLTKNFGISYHPNGDPVCDEALEKYVEELDDATKVLHGTDGTPINFSDMPMDVFLEARHYADTNHIEKILDMKS